MAYKIKDWTQNALSVELSMDRRKLAQLLIDCPSYQKGKYTCYRLRDVFDHITAKGKKLDPAQESAKLNQARRTKVEIETLIIKGELCRTEDVADKWFNHITACKTRLLAMPTKLAYQVVSATEYGEAEKIIKDAVYEALEELSTSAANGSYPEPEHGGGMESTTELDGIAVGG